MNYELLRSPQALRQLRHLRRTQPQIVPLIIAAVTALSDNPRPSGATKLVNRPEWRMRVGNSSAALVYQHFGYHRGTEEHGGCTEKTEIRTCLVVPGRTPDGMIALRYRRLAPRHFNDCFQGFPVQHVD